MTVAPLKMQLCLPRRRFACGIFYTNNYGWRMFWPIPRESWWPYDPGWPPKGVEIHALQRGVWDITCPSGEIVELEVL